MKYKTLSTNEMSDKKNILMLDDRDMDHGGAQRMILETASLLEQSRKYNVYVCTFKGMGCLNAGEYKFPIIALNAKCCFNLLHLFSLVKIIIRYRIKIIHAHGYLPALCSFFLAPIFGVKKRIWHFHSMPNRHYLKTKWHILSKILGCLSTDVIACSRAVAEALVADYGFAKSKIKIVYNFVSTSFHNTMSLSPLPKEIAFIPCIGHVGRMDNEKGHDVVLSALGMLKECYPNIGVVFIGTGQYYDEFKRQVLSKGLIDNVYFAGSLPYSSMCAAYKRFDILVLPSAMEAFGLSLLEAMQCGVPVIATNVGGIPELIDNGCNGILIDHGDPVALKNAIITMVNDEQIRSRYIENAIMKASMFSPNKAIMDLDAIYHLGAK